MKCFAIKGSILYLKITYNFEIPNAVYNRRGVGITTSFKTLSHINMYAPNMGI